MPNIELRVHITQEDLDGAGGNAASVLRSLFGASPVVALDDVTHDTDFSATESAAAAGPTVIGVDLAQGDDTAVTQVVSEHPALTIEVDSAGVPWNADLHNSNKRFYGKGSGAAKEGRWQWRRGSDEATREQVAQSLAEQLRASQPGPAATETAQTAGPVAENAAVTQTAGPVAENAQPAAVAQPGVAQSPLGWTWPLFMRAMTDNPQTSGSVLPTAQTFGITEIPELAARPDVMEQVATALQWALPAAV